MNSARIILVDDEPDFLHFMQLSLADCGYQVRTATGSAEAYSMMASADFDVAVIDGACLEKPALSSWNP